MARFYIWNAKTNEVIEDNSAFWIDCAEKHSDKMPFFMVDCRVIITDPEDRYGRAYLNDETHPRWDAVPNGKEGFPKEFQLALLLLGVQ